MLADKDYGLTLDGEVVAQDDPRCATTLIGKGGFIRDEEAEQYGIPKEFETATGGAASPSPVANTIPVTNPATDESTGDEAPAEEPSSKAGKHKK